MRTLTAVGMLGCLAACTTADIMERPALASFSSQRSTPEIATCLSTALAERKTNVRTERTATGVVLALTVPVAGIASVLDTISIDDVGSERRVTLRSKATKAPKQEQQDALFKPCL